MRASLLLLLLLLSTSVFAQKALFISFEHDFETILDQLSEIENVSFLSIDPDREIVMEYKGDETHYQFNKGRLYLLTSYFSFVSSSEAHDSFDKLMQSLEKISARKLNTQNSGIEKNCIAIKDGAVLKISIKALPEMGYQLSISCKKVKNTPEEEKNEYDGLVNDVFM